MHFIAPSSLGKKAREVNSAEAKFNKIFIHMAPIVQLLQLSLGEEENADQLLNQVARPFAACRFGGVKRAPRGNSMGQMGQRVRHG